MARTKFRSTQGIDQEFLTEDEGAERFIFRDGYGTNETNVVLDGYLNLVDQQTDPSITPTTGNIIVYAKSGEAYTKNPQGTVEKLGGIASHASQTDVHLGIATIERVIYVSKNGNDTGAVGSIDAAFATVQAAHDYALANFPTEEVCIKIGAGIFTGNLNVTKSKIHFVGAGGNGKKITRLNGEVTVNAGGPVGQQDNELVIFTELLISNSTGTGVYYTGTLEGSLVFDKVQVFCSAGSALVVDNNPAGGQSQIRIDSSVFTSTDSNATVVASRGQWFPSADTDFSNSGTGHCIVLSNDASILASRCIFDCAANTAVIGSTSSSITLDGSSITSPSTYPAISFSASPAFASLVRCTVTGGAVGSVFAIDSTAPVGLVDYDLVFGASPNVNSNFIASIPLPGPNYSPTA